MEGKADALQSKDKVPDGRSAREYCMGDFESYRHEPFGSLNRFIMFSYRWNIRPFIWGLKLILHVQLPEANETPPPIRMAHPFGIFVASGTRLGRNCTLFHGVTLGHQRFGNRAGAPTLGNDVIVFPSTMIIGSVTVGDRAVIGAGSVVITDVPADCIYAGNPARLVGMIGRAQKL